MDERRCGTCRRCERWDEDMGVLYDPWAEVAEPLRSELRSECGICGMDGESPIAVRLDWDMPCGGDFWERRLS